MTAAVPAIRGSDRAVKGSGTFRADPFVWLELPHRCKGFLIRNIHNIRGFTFHRECLQAVGTAIATTLGASMSMTSTGQMDQLGNSQTGSNSVVGREPELEPGLREPGGLGTTWRQAGFRRRIQLSFSFLTMLTFLLATLQFVMSRGGVSDPDIWWHLRNAQYLFQNHQLPRHDSYSFTVAGASWINHEWLAEIPFYLVWRAWGLAGVNVVMLIVIELIFLGLLYLCYHESGHFKASIAACAFCTFLAKVSYGPRTILFGYLYLVILLIILQRFRRKGDAPLWLIPPLFCLWINTHGSWSLGVIVFSIIAAAGLLKTGWGLVEAEPWSKPQFLRLVVTGLASAAVLFVNPFGARLVFYPFDLAFRQKLNISHVAEWVSVDFHDMRGKLVFVLLITLLLTALLRRRRWTVAELCLLLFALYSGLTYIRFLFLLAIVAAPLLAKLLDFVPLYRPQADTPLINAIVICVMIGSVVHYWPTTAEMQSSVAKEYPAAILPFLKAHPPNGPVLNAYLWGGYLEFNDPNVKTFVDSRVDIFEYAGVLQDYLDLLSLKQPNLLLDKYKIRYVLFPHGEPLTYVLEHDPQWKEVYSDEVSVLLERVEGGK
jgi:hypothetical protein